MAEAPLPEHGLLEGAEERLHPDRRVTDTGISLSHENLFAQLDVHNRVPGGRRDGGGRPQELTSRGAGSSSRWMGAWMGRHLGGVHACLTTAGVARRDEYPRGGGVVTQPHPSESPPGPECTPRILTPTRRRVADEGASIAAVDGIDGCGQADHARPDVRRAPRQLELHGIRRPEAVE